ncbi:DeoR/GlpR family DNA-binding transcription regulator [Sinorhizobium sp. 7-81]|uniref:DeoR/GlpR family DNA-binding transcription regulator n=1 Tax=Sinorhizobium sp. 8-89 TaxID=3049089 RepID=UPI0024C3BB25|nr:DeoR/GlpR family DNA-binding transcription regulator [Sinorhizobium sp. 8-89]MDK1494559.1 DeoR/GlpR family DNA-binding transcription regulator [Sinorhizobium sp. 8-89]
MSNVVSQNPVAGQAPSTGSGESPGTLLAASRHRQILDLLAARQEIQVATLSSELQVSMETIRRDLRMLEETGKLKRVHGGAVLLRANEELPYSTRIESLREEKEWIAQTCLDNLDVREDQLVFVGGGSTTLPLARKLSRGPRMRFVTNAIDIASALAATGQHEVVLTGGRILADHELLAGYDTLSAVSRRLFDLVVTGTNAIDAHLGFLEYEEPEAHLHQALAKHSRRYVIVADHTKFGRTASYASLSLNAAEMLVTDVAPTPEYQTAFERAGLHALWPRDGLRVNRS